MNTNYIPNIKGVIYIPEKVIEEVKSGLAKSLLDVLISEHRITVMDAEPNYIEKITQVADKMGQEKLSSADLEVLALALQMKEIEDTVVIYSDDYGLRNVAHHLNIKSIGVTTSGGNEKRLYGYECQACGTKYNTSVTECDVCGHSNLKRFRRK